MNYREIFEALSNKGRWGADDERGTLNYITHAKVKDALTLARSGRVVSIGRDLDTVSGPSNPRPVVHQLLYAGHHPDSTADFVGIAPHGFSVTHLDAVGHVYFESEMYNGRMAAEEVDRFGMRFGSIQAMAEGVVTRGVLLDVASAMGVDYLDPTAAIGPAELEAAESYWGVEATRGDAVVVRSGRMAHESSANPPDPGERAGLNIEAVRWLHQREVAVYGGDCIEQLPSPYPGLHLPLHSLGLAGMGLALLDWPDTEVLRSVCRAEGRAEFVLMMAPLRLPGGTGSAVNPLCVF
jgi:kynurenine formamidase